MSREPLYHRIMSGETGAQWAPLRAALRAASWAYGAAIAIRNRRYDSQPSRVQRVAVPVVSVGNITTGGTGKTPLVIDIIERLRRAGCSPAVVSRGYRAGKGESDELCLVRRRCSEITTVADPDRVAGARRAIERGANVIVLDDAFQHRRIHRDLDIVVIDATRPFGYDHLLPRGLLREPLSSLVRADLIVLSRVDLVDEKELIPIEATLREFNSKSAILRCRHSPAHLLGLDGMIHDLSDIRSKRVMNFAGIGNFAAFRETLSGLGAVIRGGHCFSDHAALDHETYHRLAGFIRGKEALDCLVTTEKDWVKLDPALWGAFPLPIYALAVNIEFLDDGGAVLDRLLSQRGTTNRSPSDHGHAKVPAR